MLQEDLPTKDTVYIYLGDDPPKPRTRISQSDQEIHNLGISRPSEANSLIKGIGTSVRIVLVNPGDIKTDSNKPLGIALNEVIDGLLQYDISHESRLPDILSSGMRMIWIATKGTVIALTIQDKSSGKEKED